MNRIETPKDAICPECKSENTVMLDSDLDLKDGKMIDTTHYACLFCNHKWTITKEAKFL